MKYFRTRAAGLASVAGLAAMASSAAAQSYGVGVQSSRPDLGQVVSGAVGDTVFRISPASGVVTRISGTGLRLDNTATRAKVTITCGNSGSCNSRNVNVKIGSIGSPTGPAGPLTNFTVSMGTASLVSAPAGADPTTFTIAPVGRNSSKTFWVGADFPIEGASGGQATGSAASSFYVYAGRAPDNPTSGDTGTALAAVYRPIELIKHSDLAFGRIVRPESGVGFVELDPVSGQRYAYNAYLFPSPPPSAASYTINGEGGRSISIAVPPAFNMTGPNGQVEVTTLSTVAGVVTLNSTTGNSGTYDFSIGGSILLDPETPTGAYSGAFNVTVSYN